MMIHDAWHRLVNWVEGREVYKEKSDGNTTGPSTVRLDPSNRWLVEEGNSEEGFWKRFRNWSKTNGLAVYHDIYRVFAVFVCAVVILVLLATVSFLPEFGNPDNPANNEVPQRYIEQGLEETGAVNVVAGMILDYRAFDTLGESNVLFIAVCSVLILLRTDRKSGRANVRELEVRDTEKADNRILKCSAALLVPVTFIFGIYVILNGHLSAGGGFSGGAIIGAGMILYVSAFGYEKADRFFTSKTYKWVSFAALMTYACLKSYSFFTGANHIESAIPLGTPGAILSSGLILPLNICVGCVVACTMYAFYSLFRRGEI